jgi:hypothetical protein
MDVVGKRCWSIAMENNGVTSCKHAHSLGLLMKTRFIPDFTRLSVLTDTFYECSRIIVSVRSGHGAAAAGLHEELTLEIDEVYPYLVIGRHRIIIFSRK